MKVYAGMDPRLSLRQVASHARRVEALGFDGLHVAETVHDALSVALLALEHTERITVRTAMALAFVRSPTLLAYGAWDLAAFSGGRFELGLGTQIKQHIEDRYGVPWHEPVPWMAEYVAGLRALFDTFATGAPLSHRGTHFALTRMQPYFNPGPDPAVAPPPIWLGGVNAGICQLAGAVASGFVTHPTNSNPRYLEQICRPNLEAGAKRAGRRLEDLELVIGTQVITGTDRHALDAERARQRGLLGFLCSTPAYRRTLELYGWDELAIELRQLVRARRWDALPAVVTDEVLDTLVPTAPLGDLPALLLERFGRLGDGILLPVPEDRTADPALAQAVARIQTG